MGVIRMSVRSLRASTGLSGRGHCCGTISGFWSDASEGRAFFSSTRTHIWAQLTHTHLGMDGHLGVIAAPLYHTGSGCWGQESGCLLKETVHFSPSYNEAEVWSWMSDSGFPSGAVRFYLREVNAWKSLARLMSE